MAELVSASSLDASGTASVSPFAGKFQVRGLQRASGAFPMRGGALIGMAVGSVSVNSGINVFENRKRCRLLHFHIWSSTLYVMRAHSAA